MSRFKSIRMHIAMHFKCQKATKYLSRSSSSSYSRSCSWSWSLCPFDFWGQRRQRRRRLLLLNGSAINTNASHSLRALWHVGRLAGRSSTLVIVYKCIYTPYIPACWVIMSEVDCGKAHKEFSLSGREDGQMLSALIKCKIVPSQAHSNVYLLWVMYSALIMCSSPLAPLPLPTPNEERMCLSPLLCRIHMASYWGRRART